MEYSYILQLADNMLKNIFKNKNIESLDKYEQAYFIYHYLTDLIEFDYDLWERKKNFKRGDYIPHPTQQVIDVFTKHKGYCSAIAQTYKLLLERLGIEVVAVVGYDEDDIHQWNLVYRNGVWSFDDITLGIIRQDKRGEYFDYDDFKVKNQEVLGILPEGICDGVFGRHIKRDKCQFNLDSKTQLYELPTNVQSIKDNQKSNSMTR